MISEQKVISIQIDKLKNLVDVAEIPFIDANLTAILGVNGCGKSTILHALACCYKPIPKLERINYKFSDFFLPTPDSHWQGSQFALTYSFRNGKTQETESKVYAKQRERWTPRYDRRPERHVEYIGISTCVPQIESETSRSIINYTTTTIQSELDRLIKEKAGAVLNRAYDELTLNEYKVRRKTYIGVKSNSIRYSSLSMGAGEQRVFFILDKVFKAPKHSLILIDEVDLLLHDDALSRLLKVVKTRAEEKKIQIVFTTHRHSILQYQDFINIRHLHQTSQRTFCFFETKPDAIQRLTGTQDRPLDIFVEDDLAQVIVTKVAATLGIAKYISVTRFGPAINCFTLVAGLLLKGETLEDMIFVLDGDSYKTESERMCQIKKVLTGDTDYMGQLRTNAISAIKQFDLGDTLIKPEKFLHNILIQMPLQNSQEYDEIISIARAIVAVDDNHRFIDSIVERLGYDRRVGLTKIIDLIATSQQWISYTSEVYSWLSEKRVGLIEPITDS